MFFLKFFALSKCYLIGLAEEVRGVYDGETSVYFFLNRHLFDEDMYKAHIDLYCEIYYWIGFPRPNGKLERDAIPQSERIAHRNLCVV